MPASNNYIPVERKIRRDGLTSGMQPIQALYITMVTMAFLSSLINFRLDTPFHLRLFSGLLGITFLIELWSAILNYRKINNWWLYNLFTLVEFPAYAWFYLQIINLKIWRKIIWGFLLFFPIFWAALIFTFGLKNWFGSLITTGSFFCVLFALMYYHRIITDIELVPLRTLPEFWIATGMLIFYLGSFAYFGMMNFLLKYGDVAARLIPIYQFLDILMYGLFTYGFLCRIINTKKFSSS